MLVLDLITRRAGASLAAFALVAAPAALAAQTTVAKTVGQMAPSPDPRVGLKPGMFDAAEAIWNLKLISATKPSPKFMNGINSDLAFNGNRVFQGSFNGWQVWDISNPSSVTLLKDYFCPGSQSDVSVYKNLLFVSGEGLEGRLDCAGGGVKGAASTDRLRGLRIFDVTDLNNPKSLAAVQTCRGSHTHSVLVDPKDPENIYVYISGSAPVRPDAEMPGCVDKDPKKDPNSALFRIEVIKVPLKDPSKAAIVSSPRIFNDLAEPPTHGLAPEDIAAAAKQDSMRMAAVEKAKAAGGFTAMIQGKEQPVGPNFVRTQLDSLIKVRGGAGAPTGADSAKLREVMPVIVARLLGEDNDRSGPRAGPTQCHDITLYPGIGYAGGACEGYGLLLDIKNPTNPMRIGAVSDSNFSYWHSATFNNDGSKVIFTDEWGGGMAPKCRASDPRAWGANAIFTLVNGKMEFQSYYKLPAPQTSAENCVAHNGSLIPIPGRDIMVQAWYQGGISVFEFTDPRKPTEIAFHDRGPATATIALGGSWSVYWYNGLIVSSEIMRGLDIFELEPSGFISQNEIDAAKTVKYDYLNAQGQPSMVWPASFALSRAYVDQLERSSGLAEARVTAVRTALDKAEKATGAARARALVTLASAVEKDAAASSDKGKVGMLSASLKQLAAKK